MDDKIHKLTVEGEFKVCPLCGYKDGFHSAFKKDQGTTLWLFICPSCHAVFDVGYTLEGGAGS
jgi:transcription initiation factor IIE alpha subunit